MILEEISPRLLWRIDNFSIATYKKTSSFRYLNADWQWEYFSNSDDLSDEVEMKFTVLLMRLSPSISGETRVEKFKSFVSIKAPEGRTAHEQICIHSMEPRNKWVVYEIEKTVIENEKLIWKDCSFISCSLEPIGTYYQLESLEKKSPMFTSPCLQDLNIDFGKLLKDPTGTFADITLECKGLVIQVHRSILVCRSEKFAALLRSHDCNTNENLTLDDIEPKVLEVLIGYIYTGSIKLTTKTVLEIYKASTEYGVQSLKKRCALFIMENIATYNSCEILLLAEDYEDDHLKAMVSSQIANCPISLESEDWKKFSENHQMLAINVFQLFVERTYLRS